MTNEFTACVLYNSSARLSNTELRTQKFEFRSKKEQADPRKIKRIEVALSKFIIRRSCLCQEMEIDQIFLINCSKFSNVLQ